MTHKPIHIDNLEHKHGEGTVFVQTVLAQYRSNVEFACTKAFLLDVLKKHGPVAAFEVAKYIKANRRTLTKWWWEMRERPQSATARIYGTLPKHDVAPALDATTKTTIQPTV